VLLYVLSFYLVGERGAAQRAVAYIALFPYAFILQTLYSETTFLVCALATFLFAERRRSFAAAIFAGAAMLARPFGIASSLVSSSLHGATARGGQR
jgi:Gpi18-like mannosyltransferase